MKKVALIIVLLVPSLLIAGTVGVVQGRVVDPSGGAVVGASIRLVSALGGQERTATTDAEGRFEFDFVEAGLYRLISTFSGLQQVDQRVTAVADQSVTVQVEFVSIANVATELTVSDTIGALDVQTPSIQTGLSSRTVERMAGASESMAAIESQTGTAWRAQEHLHIRGAHQIGFEVNGITIPDQSLFGAITPFIDARNLKYAEITTGGLLPEFGNRTAGVVNAITRSGFDTSGLNRFEVSGGNLNRGSAFLSVGNHVGEKFAYYLQGGSLTSHRGFNPPPDRIGDTDVNGNGTPDVLDDPVTQERHNYRRTFQTFGNFEFKPNGRDYLNVVTGAYRSDFQIPNTIDEEESGRDYEQYERDHFENIRWTRTLQAETLLTVNGYHHFNKLEVSGRVEEPAIPLSADNRRANYWGWEVSLARHLGSHLFKIGTGTFITRLRDDFSVIPNPRGTANQIVPVHSKVPSSSWNQSIYAQDQFDVNSRFSLNYGARVDIFRASYRRQFDSELKQGKNFLSPRLGFTVKLNDNVSLFSNGAYLMILPPLEYFEFPADTSVFPEGVSYTPARPERDVQYDVGVRFNFKGQGLRINQWFKRQLVFLDHSQIVITPVNGSGELINPNTFLPINLDRARTHGVELFYESSNYRGLSGHVNYSFNYSQATGGVLYGFSEGEPPQSSYFFLDHDQRHRIASGLDFDIEKWKAFVDVDVAYASGFPDASDGVFGACAAAGCRLPAHTEVSLSAGKSLNEHVDAKLEIENLTNTVYPLNIHSDFNGSHVSAPRQVTGRLTFNF